MKRVAIIKSVLKWLVFLAVFLMPPYVCAEDEFFGEYFARRDTMTQGAGDAKAANAAAEIIDPWPHGVTNRRIPGNGQRMSGAVERYRDVGKLREAPPPIVSQAQSGSSGSSSGGAR